MTKKTLLPLLLTIALFGAALPAGSMAQAQDATVSVLADDTAQEVVDAWIAAYGEQNPDVAFDVTYAPADALLGDLSAAQLVITRDMPEDLPIEFECGTIGPIRMLLPDLAGRFLSSVDCDGPLTEPAASAAAFLEWMTRPDGQQVAIDLGLLPSEVTVTDQIGDTVTIPQPVRRIISAYGVSTFFVYPVGGEDRLVAGTFLGIRSDEAYEAMTRIHPGFPEVESAVSTLGQGESNLEEIAAMHPDLLLVSRDSDWLSAADELGIPILHFEGETPEGLKDAVALLGAALGPDAAYRAEQFAEFYDEVLGSIREQTATIEDRTTVYFSGTNPLRVASGGMYQTAMVEAAGGVSVSKDSPGAGWQDVNLEQVYNWNPEVIFVPTYGRATVEAFTDDPQWAPVQALTNGRVIQLPQLTGPLDTPAPDSLIGIIWMANQLYPGQLDLDCEALTTKYYARFYEYNIIPEEMSLLCS